MTSIPAAVWPLIECARSKRALLDESGFYSQRFVASGGMGQKRVSGAGFKVWIPTGNRGQRICFRRDVRLARKGSAAGSLTPGLVATAPVYNMYVLGRASPFRASILDVQLVFDCSVWLRGLHPVAPYGLAFAAIAGVAAWKTRTRLLLMSAM